MTNLQLTLSILKPYIIKNPYASTIIQNVIKENNIEIVRHTSVKLTKALAEKFYEEHQGKFFLNRLQSFMCSGPIDVFILGGDDVISKWRTLLGPTKVYKAIYSHPDSLRGLFGLSDTRNVGHGSDSMEAAKREIEFFFSDFNVDQWLDEHRK
ncbi:nucleoside diphosphate kinase 6 [Contarinia nasturtii]|uniref:nucleoside diphosphate kinase 6 n=1 Tax=Contarinia nasturtii TaxID=265458 RepID=UPI0012D41A4B|nr:nucleoside diphosphate kinase 6 [Contarinia nasturtii]